MKFNSFFFALFISSFSAHFAFSDVKVYLADQAPVYLEDDLSIAGLNRGGANQGILEYLDRHRAVFGLEEVSSEVLPLRRVQRTSEGTSLRLIQRYHRVHIEGAEVVAIFDTHGNLSGLNSSLVPTPETSVQPDISREKAYRTAVRLLGYQRPEAGQGTRDGLLLVPTDQGKLALVWQFSIREAEDGSRPLQVQVLARGKHAGGIFQVLSAAHTFGGTPEGKVTIYDASVSLVIPNPLFKGVKVLENGRRTFAGHALAGGPAHAAHENLSKSRQYFADAFDRVGYDGNDAAIDASVNVNRFMLIDLLGQRQNAGWMAPWKMFVFGGGGEDLGGFAEALDVVGHEFTHAVVTTSSDLAYVHQSGALNEHFADVFGATVQYLHEKPENPFVIGESLLRGELANQHPGLRDMLNPALGLSEQPGSVSEIPKEFGDDCDPQTAKDNCGVHILSGIPNRAAALMIQEVGWEVLQPVFYRVMTARLRSTSNFADYKQQMIDECDATLGANGDGKSCDVVRSSLAEVGL